MGKKRGNDRVAGYSADKKKIRRIVEEIVPTTRPAIKGQGTAPGRI